MALLAGIGGAVLLARGRFPGGALLSLGSVVALRWRSSFWDPADFAQPSRTARLLLLAAVAAVAAVYRGYRMVPPGLWGDDAINGLLAFDVLDGKIASPFQLVHHSASRFHALANYLIAASFWALGPDLASLRLPGVLLNFLCVLLIYGTFAPLFRTRVALVAALLFAVSPQQIAHGKILLQAVTGEFLHLLAMCLLVRGIQGPRRWLVPLAGIPLGLSLCTYHAYKLGPLVALAYAFDAYLHRPRDGSRLASWLLAGVVVLLLAALPGLAGYAADPLALTGRIAGTAVSHAIEQKGSLWPVWESLWRTLAIFHYQQGPVSYHWFGIGTDPALDAVTAGLVLHGLAQSLARWRDRRHRLLLLWFAIGLLPGVLSSEAPRGYRILLATPPVFVWAALPVARLFAWTQASRRRGYAQLASVLLLAASLVAFNDYFVRTYTHREYLWMQGSRMVDMARTARRFGPDWKVYLVSTSFNASHETVGLLKRMWGIEIRDAAGLTDFMPRAEDGNALVIFDPSAEPGIAALQSWYPGVNTFSHRQPAPRSWPFDALLRPRQAEGRTMAVYLPLSSRIADSSRGLSVVHLDAAGLPLGTDRWTSLTLPPASERAPEPVGSARSVVTGGLYVPQSGVYGLRLGNAEGVAVSIDGRPILGRDQPGASIELVQGLHALGVQLEGSAPAGFELLWKPPGQSLRPIPPTLLYRDGEARGWMATWTLPKGELRRLEPLPWYQFLTSPAPGASRVRWRGRLRVPEGGRWLEVRSRGAMTLLVDGKPWTRGEPLAAGDHDVDLRIDKIEGEPLLVLQWGATGAAARPIPPEAFLPPPEFLVVDSAEAG